MSNDKQANKKRFKNIAFGMVAVGVTLMYVAIYPFVTSPKKSDPNIHDKKTTDSITIDTLPVKDSNITEKKTNIILRDEIKQLKRELSSLMLDAKPAKKKSHLKTLEQKFVPNGQVSLWIRGVSKGVMKAQEALFILQGMSTIKTIEVSNIKYVKVRSKTKLVNVYDEHGLQTESQVSIKKGTPPGVYFYSVTIRANDEKN